ncbi:uncharacterized mitochondrial protein AtMg00300-like [Salvia miltiorrhiza]|uniref:uncharacterized mitochondrial protein AtMg00300-like n=1 Tax=Salvia miltiorrhiza TaxID=226208 RepID=UPI0025ABA00C|nr:uncharacterized mitochondrial protein AtMg00300-like [Salvia miltiorrhiza]
MGFLYVMKEGIVVLKEVRKNNLYCLVGSTVVSETEAYMASEAELWHKRLAHVGEKGIKELQKQNLLSIITLVKLKICEDCILGKSKKIPYPTSRMSTKEPFEYVHGDL